MEMVVSLIVLLVVSI